MLFKKNFQKDDKDSKQPLVDYLESYDSAELMARALKDNDTRGLGSAIGDKACHLFAKIYISIFNLVKHKKGDTGWTDISYETPFDSNAGRVLFRTGFLLEFASLKDYSDWDVIQRNKGKGGTHYIRVTNIRGKRTSNIQKDHEYFAYYEDIISNYLKVGKSPRSTEIQRIPSLMLYVLNKSKRHYSIADFDDGLMIIGTQYCFNRKHPNCLRCPINQLCRGYNENKRLIKNYTT